MLTLKDNIKVGDYVRTTIGEIGKIIDCPEQLKQNYGNWLWFETKEEQRPIRKEDIKTSSPNIIDLIEKGDYVNGKEVFNPNSLKWLYKDMGDEVKDIKTIVTHEQMEAMEYKIEK